MDRHLEERLVMLATDQNCPVDATDILLICAAGEENETISIIGGWLKQHCNMNLSLALFSEVAHIHAQIWGGRYAFKNPDMNTYHGFDEFVTVVANAGWDFPHDVQLFAKDDNMTRFQQWSINTSYTMAPSVTITAKG